MKNTSMIN